MQLPTDHICSCPPQYFYNRKLQENIVDKVSTVVGVCKRRSERNSFFGFLHLLPSLCRAQGLVPPWPLRCLESLRLTPEHSSSSIWGLFWLLLVRRRSGLVQLCCFVSLPACLFNSKLLGSLLFLPGWTCTLDGPARFSSWAEPFVASTLVGS